MKRVVEGGKARREGLKVEEGVRAWRGALMRVYEQEWKQRVSE